MKTEESFCTAVPEPEDYAAVGFVNYAFDDMRADVSSNGNVGLFHVWFHFGFDKAMMFPDTGRV
ncbi:MAG: hypothetical protein GXP11_00805 [Gammaproteobacteria bacterium]|nr:hypothetical protein [Gammaproteobacteria bacterium]